MVRSCWAVRTVRMDCLNRRRSFEAEWARRCVGPLKTVVDVDVVACTFVVASLLRIAPVPPSFG